MGRKRGTSVIVSPIGIIFKKIKLMSIRLSQFPYVKMVIIKVIVRVN